MNKEKSVIKRQNYWTKEKTNNKVPFNMYERFFWYFDQLEKRNGISLNQIDVNRIVNEILTCKYNRSIIPQFVYHSSSVTNRESIIENGLIAFENSCPGVFANVPQSYNPRDAYNFYPSLLGDSDLSNDRLDFWQINTYLLPNITWFDDKNIPSHRSYWVFTLNNIPAFTLRLFKARKSKNGRSFELYPIHDINKKLQRIQPFKIDLYY